MPKFVSLDYKLLYAAVFLAGIQPWASSSFPNQLKWKEYGTPVNLPRQRCPSERTGRTKRALISKAAKGPMVTLDEMKLSTDQV